MLRMQMACITIVLFLAVIYFSAKRNRTYNHILYSGMIYTSILNLVFDMITVYTVNHLNSVPDFWNHLFHQVFIGSLVIILFLTFNYVLMLMKQGQEKSCYQSRLWLIPLFISLGGVAFLPLYYKSTSKGNYSYGPAANMAYISVGFYLIVSLVVLIRYWKSMNVKKRFVVMLALLCELITTVYQAFHPQALLSGLGITLINLSLFLTVESPDVHLIERLRIERERADLANKAKSVFLASMSHEIRTPINSIMGMNEMILRESSEEDVRQYSKDVKSASQSLCSIINDILDLSKIESGKMEIIPVEYDLSSLIHDIVNMNSVKAREKKLAFNIEVEETLPSRLLGDDVRIRQILTNLLTNAVKYTKEGTVTLRIYGQHKEEKEIITFEVEDTGTGIHKEDIPRLFEAYERIEEKKNRNIEGTGLGINITMQLLKMMGSKLDVESEYGIGSKFSFSLEQTVMSDETIGDFESRMKDNSLSSTYEAKIYGPGKKILIVDDNEMNRKVFVALLKTTGFEITEAESGQECLQLVGVYHFDLIFMDHMMPVMDGIETLHQMQKLKVNKCIDTPVIILTANAVSGAKEEYIKEGFKAYLSKPIVPDKLEKLIGKLLPECIINSSEENESASAGYQSKISETSTDIVKGFDVNAENTGTELPYVEGMDWSYARLHFPEDTLLRFSLCEFAQSIPDTKQKLEQLYQEIEDNEKLKLYHIHVHGLKGTSAMVGAVALSGLAKVLEAAASVKNIDYIRRLHPVLMEELDLYEQRLQVFVEKPVEKRKIEDKSLILAQLEMLRIDMDDMDIDAADHIMQQLEQYEYRESIQHKIDRLKILILNLECEQAESLILELITDVRMEEK